MTVARSCSASVVIELVVIELVVVERGGRGGGGGGGSAAAADSGGGEGAGDEPHGTMVERISVGSTEPLFVMGTVAVGRTTTGCGGGCCGGGGVEVVPSL